MLTLTLHLVLLQADPQSAVRDKMLAAAALQRESVKRQAAGLGLGQARESVPIPTSPSDDFFLTPWPRPEGFTDPGRPAASPEAAPPANPPPKTTPASFACVPLPGGELDALVADAARRHGLSSDLLRAVVRQESAGYPCAVSPVGAVGLMQLMPQTARSLDVRDPADARQNIEGGARYLRELLERYGGDVSLALGAYNAGPGTVDRYGGLPPFAETQGYVANILGWLTRAKSDQ